MIQRWELAAASHSAGEWVRYEDHVTEIERLERWAAFLRCCALSGEVPIYDTRDEFEAAAAGKEGVT